MAAATTPNSIPMTKRLSILRTSREMLTPSSTVGKTYQLMVPYWPDVAKNPSGQTKGDTMNSPRHLTPSTKLLFSQHGERSFKFVMFCCLHSRHTSSYGLLSVSAFSQETVSEMMERVDKGDAAAADRLGHASVFWTNDVVTFLVKLGDRGIPILNGSLVGSDPGEKGFYSDWCGSGRIVIRRNILRALSGARDARSIPYLIRALPVTDDCSPSFSPCYLCVSSPSSPLVGFIAREA